MLLGEFQHSFDPKGRIAIPAKFRSELGEKIVIALGMDDCLSIYSDTEYRKEAEKLLNYNSNKEDVRALKRVRFSQAAEVPFDAQGRILVPSNLAERIGLGKECTIIGQFDHLEMWDPAKWNAYINEKSDESADISERLD